MGKNNSKEAQPKDNSADKAEAEKSSHSKEANLETTDEEKREELRKSEFYETANFTSPQTLCICFRDKDTDYYPSYYQVGGRKTRRA